MLFNMLNLQIDKLINYVLDLIKVNRSFSEGFQSKIFQTTENYQFEKNHILPSGFDIRDTNKFLFNAFSRSFNCESSLNSQEFSRRSLSKIPFRSFLFSNFNNANF